jgi:hypothetical protein
MKAKKEKKRAIKEALIDMVWQFANEASIEGKVYLTAGGLSALEEAFDALGWHDPYAAPERQCMFPGCDQPATCGTPTVDGYKRLCFKHYKELGI